MDTKTNRKMVDSGVEWIGEVPEAWEIQRLMDLVVVTSGSQQIKGTLYEESKPELFPAYSASGQDVWSEKVDFRKDGIVLSAVGARCGKCFKANGAWAATANTHVIFTKNEEARDFFWYLLNDEDMWIKGGTAQPFVQVQATLRKEVALPPLPEQQAISNYLDHHVGLIDEERELISKKIELLKEKRSALIFEVVTGKRTLVEAQHLAGVDDWSDAVGSGELMAVPAPRGDDPFVKSGRLVDSGVEWIGEMPEGWTVKPLRSLAKITNGGTPTSEAMFWDGGIAWATPADFRNGETLYETTRTLTPEGIRKAGSMMPIGTILVSCRAPVGKVCMVGAPVSFNQGCKGIAPISEMNNRYVFYSLQASAKEMEIVSSGTTFMEISTSSLGKIAYPCPPLPTQQSIADFLDFETGLIDKEIDLLTQKNELLSEQRKALIFEAVTGKIEITE